jgi:hypothetical protein
VAVLEECMEEELVNILDILVALDKPWVLHIVAEVDMLVVLDKLWVLHIVVGADFGIPRRIDHIQDRLLRSST